MKKYLASTAALLLMTMNAPFCLAGQAAMAQPDPLLQIWAGYYFTDHSTAPSPAATPDVPRAGTRKAAEWYSLEDSPAFGVLYSALLLPHRLHLEADVLNENDWFGDFRHSYKDLFQARLVSRRFVHNLNNIAVYGFDEGAGFAAPVERRDMGIDDYGLRLDINEYLVRLKTPNYPLHVYSEGLLVKRKGKQQHRFLGGSGYFNERVRVTESREIDQQTEEYSLGTNVHLGPVEIDYARTERRFGSKAVTPLYSYSSADYYGFIFRDAGLYSHNVIPDLKASTDTVKIHTSHTGRIFASATFSETAKENVSSAAKAENSMRYGEIALLPKPGLYLALKYRHQENKASAPPSVTSYPVSGVPRVDTLRPGVEAEYETFIADLRYTPFPRFRLKARYTRRVTDYADESAEIWSRPMKITRDTYGLGADWRLLRSLRLNADFYHRENSFDFHAHSANNEPEEANQGVLGLTWMTTPRITTLLRADVAKEKGDRYRQVHIDEMLKAEQLRQHYLASASFAVSPKLSVTPAYTFISTKRDRDMVWGNSDGLVEIDTGYSDDQKANNYAVSFMYLPWETLQLNFTADYTIGSGSYDPTSPFTIGGTALDLAELAMISETKTREVNLRFNGEYQLKSGWGTGLSIRYTDWSDDSFDNPAKGELLAGLVRLFKKF
jgi:hypothetical protein